MESFEGQNWAILKTVKIIEYTKASFSISDNPIDFNNISIQNGYNFVEIPHIFESAGFSENETIGNSGAKWSKKVTLTIPKLRNEVFGFLKSYENRKLILLITDMNNISHLVYPLRMLRKRNIPGQAVTLNATVLEFAGEWYFESPTVTDVA